MMNREREMMDDILYAHFFREGGHYRNFIISRGALICHGLIESRCVIYFYRLLVWVSASLLHSSPCELYHFITFHSLICHRDV